MIDSSGASAVLLEGLDVRQSKQMDGKSALLHKLLIKLSSDLTRGEGHITLSNQDHMVNALEFGLLRNHPIFFFITLGVWANVP